MVMNEGAVESAVHICCRQSINHINVGACKSYMQIKHFFSHFLLDFAVIFCATELKL